jgi:hypothetical protein
MSEVLVNFESVLRVPDGGRYTARACGRARADGTWEGWIEFLTLDGGERVRTGRETTQPNYADVMYWATGLTDPYLDGALLRALRAREPAPTRPAPPPMPPPADGPAEHGVAAASGSSFPVEPPHAVLDPFHVYAEGDEVLRGQLLALSEAQLRNIVRAYRLSDAEPAELERLDRTALVALIMRAVAMRSV